MEMIALAVVFMPGVSALCRCVSITKAVIPLVDMLALRLVVQAY